jgi:hypothetical protein
MPFFLAAFGLLRHILFWGAGLALWLTPRPWRRWWAVFAAPAGVLLQSAVVWVGAFANLPGTNSYARWSELLPVVLLAAVLVRKRRQGLGCAQVWGGWRSLGGVWLAMAIALGAMILPMALSLPELTTSSLGSCDAADYAAGARVLQEFARSERGGFIGETEVVRVQSVDNFYDFWLRLNHFTPSAVVALNGSVFGLAPHELIGVATAVFLALSLPVVFWLARAGLRYRPAVSGSIAALYGISPITLYAVYHVATAQLLAAMAIALLTWAGVALWRQGAGWRRGMAMGGLLAVAYGLILGSYNFILIVCLVPSVAFAGGQALWKNDWRRLLRWTVLMLAPLVFVGIFFLDRVLGLVERFILFGQSDFGWRIPMLTPEGWLGMVAGPGLDGFSNSVLRWALGGGAIALLGFALMFGAKKRGRGTFLVFCLTVPIFIGYFFLLIRGARQGTNASYDAYKLFAVFYPGILAAACYWMTLLPTPRVVLRWVVLVFAALVVGFNARAAYHFMVRMKKPVFNVSRDLAQVQKIEAMPAVQSVNVLLTELWSRLWANAFLLRKPEYFSINTYEGRLSSELKGQWDLIGGIISLELPARSDTIEVSPGFTLVNTQSPSFVRVWFGNGWYDDEHQPNGPARWRWTRGDATLIFDNPQKYPVKATCRIRVRSMVDRDLQVWVNGRQSYAAKAGTELQWVSFPALTMPPGNTVIELRSSQPPVRPGPNDQRLLGLGVYGIKIRVSPDDGKTGRLE